MEFWKTYLKGSPRSILAPPEGPIPTGSSFRSTLQFELGEELASSLRKYCSENRITAAIAMQRLWGEILTSRTNSKAAVFGWAVSGRNIPLLGVEEILGVMTTTVPCKVDFSSNWTFEMLQHLQMQSVRLQEAAHTPLNEILAAAGYQQGEATFNTMLVVENFELTENLPMGPGYHVTGMEWIEKGAYPLIVGVIPREDYLFEFNFDTTIFGSHFISDLQVQITQVLHKMCLTETKGENLAQCN